jgi:hypothetical protein
MCVQLIIKLLKLLPLKRGAARAPKLARKGSDAPAHVLPNPAHDTSKGCSRRALARRRYILRRTKLGGKGEFERNRGLNTRLWSCDYEISRRASWLPT